MNQDRKNSQEKRDVIEPPNPDEKIKEAKDPLSRLFRMALYGTKMSMERWDQLMKRFIDNDILAGQDVSTRQRSTARSNHNDMFLAETMTGRTFILAIQFLFPLKARLSLHMEFPFANFTRSIIIFTRDPKKYDVFEGKEYNVKEGIISNKIDINTGGEIDIKGIDKRLYNRLKKVIDEYQGENGNDL